MTDTMSEKNLTARLDAALVKATAAWSSRGAASGVPLRADVIPALLAEIAAAGYRVVPVEPTDAMLDAARVSWPWAPGMTQKQTDAAKYRAMLAAAPAVTKEPAS